MSNDEPPVLPYTQGGHPSSGYAGSDASRERAEREDSTGVTSRRQRAVLRMLATYGSVGVTYSELGLRLNLHHGQASGVLSGLHKVGAIARLADKRHRCHVYVLPEYVDGREVQPPGRVARPGLGPVAEEMARLLRLVEADTVSTGQAIDRVLAEYDRIVRQ
jgi:hypothetical protein